MGPCEVLSTAGGVCIYQYHHDGRYYLLTMILIVSFSALITYVTLGTKEKGS